MGPVAAVAFCAPAEAQVFNAITGCYEDPAGIAPPDCRGQQPNAPSSPSVSRPAPPEGPFASIAYSESTFIVGASYLQYGLEKAKQAAIDSCVHNGGGKDCKAVAWTLKGCAAIAISPPGHRYGWSGARQTRLEAWNAALNACQKNNGNTCKVMTTPCSGDTWQYSPPLPLPPAAADAKIDGRVVGKWALAVPGGRWIWELGAGGTYTAQSQTPKNYVPSHAGTFTAANGKWTSEATAGGVVNVDGGTYTFQGPDIMVMTGKQGTGAWVRTK